MDQYHFFFVPGVTAWSVAISTQAILTRTSCDSEPLPPASVSRRQVAGLCCWSAELRHMLEEVNKAGRYIAVPVFKCCVSQMFSPLSFKGSNTMFAAPDVTTRSTMSALSHAVLQTASAVGLTVALPLCCSSTTLHRYDRTCILMEREAEVGN